MLFKRIIQEKINKWLLKDEIIILNGARQVGKTCLLKLLQEDLKNNNIKKEQIFYLNLEDIEILDALNQSPKNLLKYIIDKNKKHYFFIDEIQYLDNPSNFLKYLYDEHRDNVKLIVSGSSSIELKAKLQDSLVGRKVVFYVNPLTFYEFLIFKNVDIISYYRKYDMPENIQNEYIKLLDEYLLFGGMPKIVLTSNINDKKFLLNGYVSDYINKDIRYIGKIDNILKFNHLIKVLSAQTGSLININELTNTLNIKRKEIEYYINLLENTFVIHRVVPFYQNIRSQIVKMPKLYFFDIGIRNQIMGNFVDLQSRTDSGKMFENFIYLELINLFEKNNIYFYRTTHKAEIDFIIECENKVIPVEVKYKNYKKPAFVKVLNNFLKIDNLKSKKAYVININLNDNYDDISYLSFNCIEGLV